ncbi:hypothetical protein NRO40_22495 [Streptomyces changanensis]|uniref:Uncharacterized protein n=1 Tax=Streptomyces changanensis TaxID=2964669 RepID=A0ABY5NG04_9ACTN|nr:hypothetical protein NRO40_22495 [Streptomyces changanensis]
MDREPDAGAVRPRTRLPASRRPHGANPRGGARRRADRSGRTRLPGPDRRVRRRAVGGPQDDAVPQVGWARRARRGRPRPRGRGRLDPTRHGHTGG